MPLRVITTILLCVIAWLPSTAQVAQYNFSKVDLDNGLSSNQVYTTYRDNLGFVWFGTASGLNRFDGYSCKVFTNSPTDTTSLKENYVTEIFPLPGNKLWVGSNVSGCIYDPTTERFERNFQKYFLSLGLPDDYINSTLIDGKGNFWVLFEKEGLYRYTPNAKRGLRYPRPLNKRITALSTDRLGNIWLVYADGNLYNVDVSTMVTLNKVDLLKSLFKGGEHDFRVFADRKDKIWCYINGEPKGIYKIDPANGGNSFFHTTSNLRLSDNMIKGLVQDKEGRIWVATDHGGVDVINETDHSKIDYLQNKENDKTSLSYNSIEHLYSDNKGIVWIGTGKKGVNYINENISKFELFTHDPANKSSLPYNDINYFTEDRKGNIWIGTNGGGLIFYDKAAKTFTRYVNNPSNPNSLSNNVIVSLCLDHENKLWIGTYHGGLDVFDGKNFTHYRHNPADANSIADDRIWHILEDRNNIMWIGTLQGGLNRFDRTTKKFTHYYFQDEETPKPLHSNYIPIIREDRNGNLLIGTSEGLEVFDRSRKNITYYKLSDAPGQAHHLICDILEDKDGRIWLGTRNGLVQLDLKTKRLTRYQTTDGLPDNSITNLIQDRNGDFWITTPKGLSQLMMKREGSNLSFAVRSFSEANRLQGRVFNESASLTASDGKIYVGGSTGFNIIDPAQMGASQQKPTLVFTCIEIFNNEVNINGDENNGIQRHAMPFADEIVLKHRENIFSIEFTALDFSNNNQYAYKLEGFNKNWMYTNSANRKVTYTNLDPGTYYFKVRATNTDGIWSKKEKTLKIVIRPPFWKTPLAFVLYIVLTGLLLYLSRRFTLERAEMRFEVEQQRKEAERIQALDAVKTKFFTNVSHEFRTPLSLILTPLDRILKNTPDAANKKQIQLVQRNAKRLLNLVNQLLDFRKMEVQDFKLQPTEGDIVKFAREITMSFSDISEMRNVALSFQTNVNSLLTPFDKDKLEKILFNLLSNAFKYTLSQGLVAVIIDYKEKDGLELFEMTIRDTGIGIPADKQEQVFERFFQNDVPANVTNPGTGIGLAITKEFVKLHNGQIRLKSKPGEGSSFIVTLPLKRLGDKMPGNGYQSLVITSPKQEAGIEKTTQKPGKDSPVILVVEDNDDFRFYLKDNLKQEYQVFEAVNGQDALDRLDGIKPDLIVSDVMMPLMDGVELTKRVRRHAELSAVPIILLTAVEDKEMQLESYRLGVSDYMTKPFTYEILESRIKNLIKEPKQPAVKKLHKQIDVNPSDIEITPVDELFIKQVLEVVELNISNPDFSVEDLSKALFMHRAGMYRKLLALTGDSPLEFIRKIRLKRGRQLLEKSGLTISEVAYEVGFNNPKKFSQYFKEEFGTTPSQFLKQVELAVENAKK